MKDLDVLAKEAHDEWRESHPTMPIWDSLPSASQEMWQNIVRSVMKGLDVPAPHRFVLLSTLVNGSTTARYSQCTECGITKYNQSINGTTAQGFPYFYIKGRTVSEGSCGEKVLLEKDRPNAYGD